MDKNSNLYAKNVDKWIFFPTFSPDPITFQLEYFEEL